MIIHSLKDDLILIAKERRYAIDAIAHGCNCFCKMGSGIARQIAKAFPVAAKVDRQTKPGIPKS